MGDAPPRSLHPYALPRGISQNLTTISEVGRGLDPDKPEGPKPKA